MSTLLESDHFSPLAAVYADFRPDYPEAFFDWLASQVSASAQVWEPGCGSGQATMALAQRFARVCATDLSAEQIARAPAHPRVDYAVAPAHVSGLPDQSVGLIAVAQALHWFDLERFNDEAKRVLRPGGLLCAFTYGRLHLSDVNAQKILHDFYGNVVAGYWPPGREHVENGYADLALPFNPVATPLFCIERTWHIEHLLGYVRSWSATSRYRQATGCDPAIALGQALAEALTDEQELVARWPLRVKAARRLD